MNSAATQEPGITFLAIEERDRAFLAQLAAVANVFHRNFFGGRLAVRVEVNELLNQDALGVCVFGQTIHLNRSILDFRHPCQRGGTRDSYGVLLMMGDVILHEFCHSYQSQILGRSTYCTPRGGHDVEFLGICRSLTPHLRGMLPLSLKQLTLATCPYWPLGFKHSSFYRGVAPQLGMTTGNFHKANNVPEGPASFA